MEVKGQLFAPAALPPRKEPLVPIPGSGRYREEKNLLPLQGIELRLPGRPARSLVAIPTELSRLLFSSLYLFLKIKVGL
jgi:hypothetical protein